MRNREDYWIGFAAGAGIAAFSVMGGLAAWRLFGIRSSSQHVLRMEKSVQIGKPVNEVFAAWSDFNRLKQLVPKIKEVSQFGDRTHWEVEVDGRMVEWDAVIEQEIPNQAIGWKSVSGPKHTGRIVFAPVGNDTLVHVVMNYSSPLGRFSRALAPLEDEIEVQIEKALREFKAALEGKGHEDVLGERATGTFGASRRRGPEPQDPRQPSGVISYTTDKPGTVEYTRPPEAKY